MNFKDLLSKEWFRLGGMLLIGITIGVLFYPTKRIEERMTIKHNAETAALRDHWAAANQRDREEFQAKLQEEKTLRIESEKKVVQLTSEVKTLQSKQKTAYYKIVRPDGTIEEKQFTSSEVNESSQVITQIQVEFKTKIEQIESKWMEIHKKRVTELQTEFASKEASYKKTIYEMEHTRVETVNEKRFGIEAGLMGNKNYYGHATMDVWGPVFLGLHAEVGTNNDNKLGAGLGLRF